MSRFALLFVIAAGCAGASKSDEPYIPAHEEDVLETLLRGPSNDIPTQKIGALRKKLSRNPDDLATALALADLHIAEARRLSDPRQLSYAQAALAHWWEIASPTSNVLALRAAIRQQRHELALALADLDQLIAINPSDVSALAHRASILTTQARYADAAKSCEAIHSGILFAVCSGRIAGITGHATLAYEQLSKAMREQPDERALAAGHAALGELALYGNDQKAAERELRAALAIDADDDDSRARLADLLLDENRAAEVTPLVESRIQNDAMLVRAFLAAKILDPKRAADLAIQTRDRFVASHVRGDIIHARDEARFELNDGHADVALKLAVANWQISREPGDARVLLEAAIAAKQPAAAAAALKWVDDTHISEAHLVALARDAK